MPGKLERNTLEVRPKGARQTECLSLALSLSNCKHARASQLLPTNLQAAPPLVTALDGNSKAGGVFLSLSLAVSHSRRVTHDIIDQLDRQAKKFARRQTSTPGNTGTSARLTNNRDKQARRRREEKSYL